MHTCVDLWNKSKICQKTTSIFAQMAKKLPLLQTYFQGKVGKRFQEVCTNVNGMFKMATGTFEE